MRAAAFALLAAFLAIAPAPLARSRQAAAAVASETPATTQARRLLTALTSGDDAAFLAFIHQASPKSRLSDDQWLQMRRVLAGLKYHGVLSATATNAELSVFDADREAWARVLVAVDAQAPYAITDFQVRGGRRPADVPPPPRLQPDALAAATKARLEADTAADRFSGAVLVIRERRPIFAGAYGLADRERNIPVNLDTQFRYGSIGKMFTAVAAMQLVQAGKLDLSAPIGRYLPDDPNTEIASKVTVGHLLSHTGGTGDIFGPEFRSDRLRLREPSDYVALFGARAPAFTPGTRFEYSNYGFILLGRIVEAVSGMTYDDYVQAHIYKPAHMVLTGAAPETIPLPRRAVSYTRDHGALRPATDTLPWRGTPAGGGYSTVGDLARFMDALQSGVLLDAEHFRTLTTGGVTTSDGGLARYDFGGVTGEGAAFIGHAGGAPGMNGEVRAFSDSGYTVVVLANRDPSIATVIASFISDRLP